MKPSVFIQANERQWIGALVAAHALRRNSSHAEAFDVQIMHVKDYPFLWEKDGQPYLCGGETRIWRMADLQSFTPLRFMPPKLMHYQGRAVVIDPDIFAVKDIHELLTRDMAGCAIMARPHNKSGKDAQIASSVMLLDCGKLEHWDCERQFNELFAFERDYKDWIALKDEPVDSIGLLEPEWNDFDRLTEQTRLLHNTKRRTQPWKTGLPVDFSSSGKLKNNALQACLHRLRSRLFGEHAFRGRYVRHPDPAQEQLFFKLLKECVDNGTISESMLRDEMSRNHIRHDTLEMLDRVS